MFSVAYNLVFLIAMNMRINSTQITFWWNWHNLKSLVYRHSNTLVHYGYRQHYHCNGKSHRDLELYKHCTVEWSAVMVSMWFLWRISWYINIFYTDSHLLTSSQVQGSQFDYFFTFLWIIFLWPVCSGQKP